MNDQNRIAIFWDVDNVIINTAEVLIEMIKKEYNTDNEKTIYDLKDWELKSIDRDIDPDFISRALEDSYFWQNIQFNRQFINFIFTTTAIKFDHYFVTVGTAMNRTMKKILIEELMGGGRFPDNQYMFLGFDKKFDKSIVPMEGGIQIDDKIANLANTTASIKILVKNLTETDYNTFNNLNYSIDNLYEVNTLDEVIDILNFIANNPQMLS